MNNDSTEIWNYERNTKTLKKETVLGERYIKWAYHRSVSSWISDFAFRWPLTSKLYGAYLSSGFSRHKIQPAIEQLEIDESEFLEPTSSFDSFNDFFIRKLKPECRPFNQDPKVLVSPADCRILAYQRLESSTLIPVKGIKYTIDELLQQSAEEFNNGSLLVLRLCPADYHRFHFPCDGRISESRRINGVYHSVNPVVVALNVNVFCENKRQYTMIENPIFGRFAMVEVGAWGVARIVDTFKGDEPKKMDEKGYFMFGGSTIILVFQEDRLRISPDLTENSSSGYETLVKVGEEIGKIEDGC